MLYSENVAIIPLLNKKLSYQIQPEYLVLYLNLYRYNLRVQGMLLRLEFAEKKGDLEPALKTFHEAVDGEHVGYMALLC